MLQVLSQSRNTAVVQFTGADLKHWYKEFGAQCPFFCNIITKVVRLNAGLHSMHPDSEMVIGEFRKLVPHRFKAPVKWSRTIDNNLKSKYLTGEVGETGVSYKSRVNLLKCIPDDHVFTWALNNQTSCYDVVFNY